MVPSCVNIFSFPSVIHVFKFVFFVVSKLDLVNIKLVSISIFFDVTLADWILVGKYADLKEIFKDVFNKLFGRVALGVKGIRRLSLSF